MLTPFHQGNSWPCHLPAQSRSVRLSPHLLPRCRRLVAGCHYRRQSPPPCRFPASAPLLTLRPGRRVPERRHPVEPNRPERWSPRCPAGTTRRPGVVAKMAPDPRHGLPGHRGPGLISAVSTKAKVGPVERRRHEGRPVRGFFVTGSVNLRRTPVASRPGSETRSTEDPSASPAPAFGSSR